MTRATVGSRELKTRLGTYLRQVQQGRTLIVIDRGRPAAELKPIAVEGPGEECRLDELVALGILLLEGMAVTSRLSEVEIASALARRQRERVISLAERNQLLEAMTGAMAFHYLVEVSSEVSALACRLLLRHGLRADDALHLASALTLADRLELKVQFVAFDRALNEAARREGLDLSVS